MASSDQSLLHFVLLPHLAQGHQIPMIDLGRLLAQRGVVVTIITTPINAAKFRTAIDRAVEAGLRINLLEVPFPSSEAGLPEGCESMDALPSQVLMKNLLLGIQLLQQPAEQLFNEMQPRPSCIIADTKVVWNLHTANKLGIPRVVFDGTSCFSLLCTENILATNVHETVSESETFAVSGLPDRIELTKVQLPNGIKMLKGSDPFRLGIREAEAAAYGVVVNTFEELEPVYVEEFRRKRGGKVWCVGPVSPCNKEDLDRMERGNRASIDETQFLNWLDSMKPRSVSYVCLGSQSRLSPLQMIELGLGLEASNHPFIWVIRKEKETEEFEKWVRDQNFEDRVKGRGILIRGWAPQVLILSHPAIGGFLTHCGWNSTLEAVTAGIPMITWPMFAEQFYNERFIVQVAEIGVSLGSKVPISWGELEKAGIVVKREEVNRAVVQLMAGGEDGEGRRKRARELGQIANKAIEEGGSSYLNLTLLIQDILEQVSSRN
ncbi:hypothetical protein SLEP1_g39242 [Rubroshorea leprosula]|uniref:Glycosyltransferase n=1 Tax=Rubroshorea leprosula TaxID=152421 RepID=A0AAV5KZK0_9ROSI|nr:hypothetical protein SLEP1_g39242 [Rubroshorea leprosula]